MDPFQEPRLGAGRKLVIGLGDHTITLSLAALSLFYVFFLTEHAGLRPALAGAVPLVGRFVDALTDPLMGRISDQTRWRWGRRRPYMLLGALPFGASFAALWLDAPLHSQLGMFAYYAGAYVVYSVASTVLAVPYTALLPELVSDYQERTSLNSFRSALTVLGTLLAALTMRPLAEAFGGGSHGFAAAASLFSLWLVVPWVAVWAVTTEREDFRDRPSKVGFLEGMGQLARHKSYRQLSAFYICGRISMDIGGMMFIFYVTYWLLRPGDFEIILGLLMTTAVAVLPLWLWVSRRLDKRTIFIAGCAIWLSVQPAMLLAEPSWPPLVIYTAAVFMGVGYAVVDMMPWSMVGEVIDEDELVTGERREGLYSGFFTFIRKLGGALGVWLAGLVLDLAGFRAGAEQSPQVLSAIRGLTALGPGLFLMLAIAFAWSYPLGRAEHREILSQLREARARGRAS